MVKATSNPKPATDVWSVDDAFRYLARAIGMQDGVAIYELTDKLLAERLRMNVKRFVDGALRSEGFVPATFWRDHLALHVVEGRAEVRPLKALEQGEYEYSLSARDVRLIWGEPTRVPNAAARQLTAKEWIPDETRRMKAAGEIFATKADFARELEARMKRDPSVRPIKWVSIKNMTLDGDLWLNK
jgi:hypothetical protein